MKYVDEYRDGATAAKLARAIAALAQPERVYRLMEFCGGHTHAISRHGLTDLLPPNVEMIHGPGCPVCVLPIERLEAAIHLALSEGVILCSYGDMLRVPAAKGRSLLKARAEGADVRMVYSTTDALQVAQDNPERQVVFFAIGFETTTPPTAVALLHAKALGLKNFSVFCNHVLTPAAIQGILDGAQGERPLDGVIGPSHVSTIIGSQAYEPFAFKHALPVVIAGFEPLDVMQSILMLISQINAGRHEVENQYIRAVTRSGNAKAQALVAEVFELRPSFAWRGLGTVPWSALSIRDAFADLDAEKRFEVPAFTSQDNKACACADIIRGRKKPRDCKLFGTACTPDSPLGACMVSSEGACAAHWTFGRFRDGEAAQ
ncbi:MAG: hydrogenase formation protein HypD [Alphaproteobacteria bacterium RIFOXYD12_FULL_60_8]|nr:MAG: hydrogenase formation protein HypD [Alphaproteobacteria bacterium RIFOXYD12_FULL_60_8]